MVGAIDEPFLNRHHMLFRGRTTTDPYGELVEFHSNEEAFKLMKERSVPPGAGMTTLTIQQRIMRFLVKCCETILHDIPATKLLDYPILPEPPLTTEKVAGRGSLVALTLEAPYRAPTDIELLKLKAIFHAKKSAAEDPVWALREDPSYFEHTLKEAMDHRYEQVKDPDGMLHPDLQRGRETLISGSVISNMEASAEYYLDTWTRLCDIIADIEAELEACGGTVSVGQTLPEEVKFQLSYFKMFLKHAMRRPLAQLKAGLFSSPPFRPYVERMGEDTPNSRKTGIHPYIEVKETAQTMKALSVDGSPEAYLQRLITLLTAEGPRGIYAEHWGFSTVVDESGRLLENEPRANNLVSSRMAQTISDLSVIAEALRQMIAYADQVYGVPMIPFEDDKGKKIEGLTVPWFNVLKEIEGAKPEQFHQLGLPTDKRFHYPSDERRTKENHGAMRSAEANLDAFWHTVDANLEVKRQWRLEHLKQCDQCCDCGVESATRKLLAQPRYMQRTGSWVDPNASAVDKQHLQDAGTRRPLSDIYLDLQQRTERTLKTSAHDHKHKHDHDHSHSHSHAKKKTRGTAAKENIPPAGVPPSEQPMSKSYSSLTPAHTKSSRHCSTHLRQVQLQAKSPGLTLSTPWSPQGSLGMELQTHKT